jgi:hypothetical protein
MFWFAVRAWRPTGLVVAPGLVAGLPFAADRVVVAAGLAVAVALGCAPTVRSAGGLAG